MKLRVVLGIILCAGAAGFAQDAPAASPAAAGSGSTPAPLSFGDTHLTVPAGWKHVETQAGSGKVLLITPSDVSQNKNLAVLLLPGQELPAMDLSQAFDTILKRGLAANERLVKYAEVPARKVNGYDLLARSMIVADDAGHRSFRVCFAANPRHRLEILIVSADNQELFTHYQAELAVLLNSWSFGGDSVPADSKKEESVATRPPARAGSDSETGANPQPGSTATGPKTVSPGTRARIPDGESVLLCKDAARLDFAMDAAKFGNTYDASRALQHDYFYRVTGPAWLEVKETELKSGWPKVFVTVLDGDSAGRTGWVVLSELKDLRAPAKP